jgi:prepilin-type N-terminal cleavage/methylation domain-containing protein
MTVYLKKSRQKIAMTLIEMLIVVSIVAVLSAALYQALGGGIRVWHKANEVIIEEDVLVFFEKFNRDINNICFFSQFSLSGGEMSFSFPSILQVYGDKNNPSVAGNIIDQIGMVEYYFDLNNRQIARRQADYPRSLEYKWDEPLPLLKNVKQFRFQYFYQTDNGEHISDIAQNAIPAGVELKLEIEGTRGVRTFERYFNIPMGN